MSKDYFDFEYNELIITITKYSFQVIRLTHGLLCRLMQVFPTEPSGSSVASKYEELECLYACVGKVQVFFICYILIIMINLKINKVEVYLKT